MERASSLWLASGMFRQACRNLDFSPSLLSNTYISCFVGYNKVIIIIIMLHRFSMGLRSGEFAGHSSFWIK